MVSTAAELGLVVEGDKIRRLVGPCCFMEVTGNWDNLEEFLLIVVQVDFHSFLGCVKQLRPNEKEEALACHFICCEDGEGSLLEIRDEESVKEAVDCCFIPCEEKEGSSLEIRREEGVKEASACCCSS